MISHSNHTNIVQLSCKRVDSQVCDKMLFIRANESLVDDLSYERGIVPSRVALCDDLLRFSLSSNDLSWRGPVGLSAISLKNLADENVMAINLCLKHVSFPSL